MRPKKGSLAVIRFGHTPIKLCISSRADNIGQWPYNLHFGTGRGCLDDDLFSGLSNCVAESGNLLLVAAHCRQGSEKKSEAPTRCRYRISAFNTMQAIFGKAVDILSYSAMGGEQRPMTPYKRFLSRAMMSCRETENPSSPGRPLNTLTMTKVRQYGQITKISRKYKLTEWFTSILIASEETFSESVQH